MPFERGYCFLLFLEVFCMLSCFGVSWYSAPPRGVPDIIAFVYFFVCCSFSRFFDAPPPPKGGFSFVFARVCFAFWPCNPTDLYNSLPPNTTTEESRQLLLFLILFCFCFFSKFLMPLERGYCFFAVSRGVSHVVLFWCFLVQRPSPRST